nr:brain tumor [Cucujiformia]
QYHKAQNEINDTFMFYKSMLEERKQELLKELESVYSAKQMSLEVATQKGQDTVEQIYKTCEFVERLNKCATIVEIIMFRKLLDTKLQGLLNYNMDQSVQMAGELEFVSNYQAIQVGVRNTFGYVRSNSEMIGPIRQPPIARPTGGSSSSGSSVNGSSGSLNGGIHCPFSLGNSSQSTSPFDSNIISKRFSSANSLGPFSTTIGELGINGINPYEKWSNGGGSDSIFQNNTSDPYSLTSSTHTDPMLELTSKLMSTAIFPPKSQIKRQKMIYHCKFGEFGVMEGQFTEPSGVAVNAQNDIIVADTNNHRIQIFDKEGRFKFQFGECGKRDGQLLYPNRVAVVRTSGDIIVTERSPTHQIQIYNQYGQFVRKFGANILQHPRGVTVDNKGRIVVVECKVMRVI